jgi:light-regulated signal transduction histidine kinase (bacteriophytochrome)
MSAPSTASRSTTTGTKPSLSSSRRTARQWAPRNRVEDNGIGFENEYAERIFGAFQRLHGRSAFEGTGIGLSIARKIAWRHGGDITATGELGNGATFRLILPLAPAEAISERTAA